MDKGFGIVLWGILAEISSHIWESVGRKDVWIFDAIGSSQLLYTPPHDHIQFVLPEST
jgi:hypothetical protein